MKLPQKLYHLIEKSVVKYFQENLFLTVEYKRFFLWFDYAQYGFVAIFLTFIEIFDILIYYTK